MQTHLTIGMHSSLAPPVQSFFDGGSCIRRKVVCGLRLSAEKLTGYKDVYVSVNFIVGHLCGAFVNPSRVLSECYITCHLLRLGI